MVPFKVQALLVELRLELPLRRAHSRFRALLLESLLESPQPLSLP
jgi:hypothetical protein